MVDFAVVFVVVEVVMNFPNIDFVAGSDNSTRFAREFLNWIKLIRGKQ